MGFIDSHGQYHSGTPQMTQLVDDRSSIWKQSDHDRQRQDHKSELVRPYLPSGEPNPEFIELYPDLAQNTYHFIKSDEELSKEQ